MMEIYSWETVSLATHQRDTTSLEDEWRSATMAPMGLSVVLAGTRTMLGLCADIWATMRDSIVSGCSCVIP